VKIFKWLLLCAFIEAFSGSLCNILFSFVRPLDDKSSVVTKNSITSIPLTPYSSLHLYMYYMNMSICINGCHQKQASLLTISLWIEPVVEPVKNSTSPSLYHPFVPLYDSIGVLFIIDKLIIHKICNKLWPLHRIVGTLIVIYWEFGLKCVVVLLNHIRIGNAKMGGTLTVRVYYTAPEQRTFHFISWQTV
jgi:hypothetical protein